MPLVQSVDLWNANCTASIDTVCWRTKMMHRIGGGPYYARVLSPSMLNPPSGTRRHQTGRVVRPDGSPIGDCRAFGNIAALNAVREMPRA